MRRARCSRRARPQLKKISCLLQKIKCATSGLQKSRHLQKSRVTERHKRGTKRKLKSHPLAHKRREVPFFCAWCDFSFRFVPRLCRSVMRLFRK